jgi:hypothetical protein
MLEASVAVNVVLYPSSAEGVRVATRVDVL